MDFFFPDDFDEDGLAAAFFGAAGFEAAFFADFFDDLDAVLPADFCVDFFLPAAFLAMGQLTFFAACRGAAP